MSEAVTLGIDVDSSKVREATEALEKLVIAAERARVALEKLGSTQVQVYRVGDIERMSIGTSQ